MLSAAARHPLVFAARSVRRRPAPHPEVAPPAGNAEALDRLVGLPLHTWTYGWEHPSVHHLGPMAQDFSATFGLGSRDDQIDLVDAAGVLMATTQALHQRVVELEARVAAIEAPVLVTTPPIDR